VASGIGNWGLTLFVGQFGRLDLGMQNRFEKLRRRGGAEQLHERRDDGIPLFGAELSDVVLQQLLETRRPDPRERVVLCGPYVSHGLINTGAYRRKDRPPHLDRCTPRECRAARRGTPA
jgi:hypothetical protein